MHITESSTGMISIEWSIFWLRFYNEWTLKRSSDFGALSHDFSNGIATQA
jgi:hypothetical protein